MVMRERRLLFKNLFHCSILWLRAILSACLCTESYFRSSLAYLLQPFFCRVAITPMAVSWVLCLYVSRLRERDFNILIMWFLRAVMCFVPSAVRL